MAGKHAYIGCVDDGTGYRTHCKCSWRSPAFVTKATAWKHFIAHSTKRRKPRTKRKVAA